MWPFENFEDLSGAVLLIALFPCNLFQNAFFVQSVDPAVGRRPLDIKPCCDCFVRHVWMLEERAREPVFPVLDAAVLVLMNLVVLNANNGEYLNSSLRYNIEMQG